MLKISALWICCVAAIVVAGGHAVAQDKQVIELRTYKLVDDAAEGRLDEYLSSALVPALKRQGLGPIGVLAAAPTDKGDSLFEEAPQVLLLVAGPSAEAIVTATAKLALDEEYQAAAKGYHATAADKPVVRRIESELLIGFDCWPQVAVSEQAKAQQPRLFELRTYESATEQLGHLKVEMFNSGEVDIFLDCGIDPVFMGQAVIGDKLPNLTYMTVYDNAAARDAAWQKFLAHPDWQTLKAVAKYQGTVSKIHKSDWVPKPYSDL